MSYKPTNNGTVNSGLSPSEKLKTSGVIPDIISNAKNTVASMKFPDMPTFSSSQSSSPSSSSSIFTSPFNSNNDYSDEESSYFSFSFILRLILIVIIGWFMWVNLANNGEFNLGMDSLIENVSNFFKSMEENGRKFYSNIIGESTSTIKNNQDEKGDDDDSEDEEDKPPINNKTEKETSSNEIIRQKREIIKPIQWHSDSINRNIPVPPDMTNSSDKKPGFVHEDTKYTFLDKAVRNYSGPSPSADDSTSKMQKQQSGKAGYCYIGEDRGFRSCIKVEAGDRCMSGNVYSRQDICMNPSLRE